MATTQHDSERRNTDTRVGEITEQLEHVFLAGLGALSNAQKAGVKIQEAVRGMTSDAQSKATGLLDQVRGASNLDKLHDVFDSRVQGALERLNVPSKKDIDAINRKLNKILKELDGKSPTASKKPRATATRKKAAKPSTTKKTASGKVKKKVATVEPDKVKVASKE
jgi:hypothetical protein